MRDTCYVIADEWGVQKLTKRAPSLRSGQVAVRIVVTIPDNAFANPHPTVVVNVPEEHVVRAAVESDQP